MVQKKSIRRPQVLSERKKRIIRKTVANKTKGYWRLYDKFALKISKKVP